MSPKAAGRPPNDWQLSCSEVKERTAYLLQSGLWADCAFLAGADAERGQAVLTAHRLVLAAASPVFEALFFGGIPPGNDPIQVPDVQPQAFEALLLYIYSDLINLECWDNACDIYYAAKKYMFPHLVEQCVDYLKWNITADSVGQIYELAKLFDEEGLRKRCLQYIRHSTMQMLDSSLFEELQLSTVVEIFSMPELNIKSEADLLHAAERYAKANNIKINHQKQSSSPLVESEGNTVLNVCKQAPDSNEKSVMDASQKQPTKPDTVSFRSAMEQIRFLALSLEEFARGPARSELLAQPESYAVLLNIVSADAGVLMPEGFSMSREPRNTQYIVRPAPPPELREALEASIEYSVHNFKTRKRTVQSEPFYIQNLSWRIVVQPTESNSGKSLHLGVKARGLYERRWSCRANVTLRLLAPPNTVLWAQSFNHTYRYNVNKGYTFQWGDVCSAERGYLRGNTLTVSAHVQAEAPLFEEETYSSSSGW